MTSDHADDDCRSSSSTATSHEEHTLYNSAVSFFLTEDFFCLTCRQVEKLPVVQQMEHSTFQVLVQFSEHFETQQELPGNPLRALHQ